jgi:hypothetical protein
VAFIDIHAFPESHPGPYERQMGRMIAGLLRVFAGRVPDAESNSRVAELAATPGRWSAGHAVFDEVRRRLLAASKSKDNAREWQRHFEESCCQAMYNAVNPRDPFDPGSAFFVVPQALGLARVVGVSVAEVVAGLAPEQSHAEPTAAVDRAGRPSLPGWKAPRPARPLSFALARRGSP